MENPFEIIDKKLDNIEKLLKVIIDNNNIKLSTIMTVEQVSEYLSLSVATLYGYTSKKEIPHAKRGKKLYFEKNAIDKWLFENNTKTNEEIEKIADTYLYRNPLND